MRNITMADLTNIKSAWKTPTGLTVTTYSPTDIVELQKVINMLLSVKQQEYITEITFSNWNDPAVSKIGVMMITPAIFLSIDDYMILCEHFKDDKSQHDHIDICGKDKLYIDSNFKTESFNTFLEVVPKVKDLKAQSLTDVNKLLTDMLSMKRLTESYRYTFHELGGEYLVHNSESSIKNCMFVMLSKVFSYYNPLMTKMEFLKAGDRNLTYFLSNNTFVANKFGKNHYDDSTYGMYVTLYSSFVEYYRRIAKNLTETDRVMIIDHYSRYVVFNESFMNLHKDSCCYVVEYNDKRFLVIESKEQVKNIKSQSNDVSLSLSDGMYVLFEKHLDKLYKLSLLKSGCGGYDEVKLKDVPLK